MPYEQHVVELRRALSPWILTFRGYEREDDRESRFALPPIDHLLDACLTLALDGLRAPDQPDAPVHSQP